MTGFPSVGPVLTLSYLQFHLVFVLPPLVGLALTTQFPPDGRRYAAPAGVALLVVIAVVYTTPWDNHLIATGVWSYGEGAVRARLWHAPLEEYLFFVLQPLITSLWLCRLPTRADRPFGISLGDRALGVLGGGLVAGVGLLLLSESTYYLGALLLWAGPVLALQWGFGWPVLWELRRTLAVGVLVPSAYLWVADRIAIELGIWTFDEQYLTGVGVLGLPIEELLFFLSTNLFVVQGLLLFWWVTDRWPQVKTLYADVRESAGV
ncbi:lycopene cyclase domain-containing protein [Halorientalis brevis]|uniref:Lycopene cyclase domain-containing protein n=1 Tax=Halorientalis brevis TaxID=1126241 RepID=A0ABD6CE11_9EURY|nr:lycopene cyclase domain-containing protein [Halorientalis brevis]